jgi:hypothetical protein
LAIGAAEVQGAVLRDGLHVHVLRFDTTDEAVISQVGALF